MTAVFLFLFSTSDFFYAQSNEPFSINNSPLPAPTSPVMDYAGVMDAAAKQNLERRIIEFRDRTNPRVELAVAVVNTTGERPIFDYSLAVARGWKIGSKEQDNPSALLLIAVDDRKAYAQISKDLEDELPDSLAVNLQRQYLVPAFQQKNYSKGISDTIDAFIRTIEQRSSGQTNAAPTASPRQQPAGRESSRGGCNFVTCLIILFVLMIIIFSRGGGGGGGFRRRRYDSGFGSALPWIIGSAIGSSIGSRDSSSGWSGGSWGGSSGGDSWGGFGGGGDFGGGGGGVEW